MFFERILNLGTKRNDDVNRIRLIRQINGLNLFFSFIAFSVGLVSFLLLRQSTGGRYLTIVQIFATLLYLSNLLFNVHGFKNYVRHFTIYAFEIHLFLCALITGFFYSPVMLVIVLFPLLAALVEVSIFQHLFVGFIQLILVVLFHFFFQPLETQLNKLLLGTGNFTEILRIMGLAYFPVMAAGIIKIIFNENLSARKKQKMMITELNQVHQKLKKYTEALKDESIRLRAEVNVAKDIQAMVLPDKEDYQRLQDFEVSGIMRPANEVGGDYYDVITTDDKVIFGIGDVTGHGLVSGIIMMMAQTAIKTIVETPGLPFEHYLPLLNRVLYANIARINVSRNMTLSLFKYEGQGKYLMTGQHEFYLIYRANTKTVNVEDTMNDGFFIGMVESVEDFSRLKEFSLQPDDVLLLFSDGVTEAENPDGEQFGLERLTTLLQQYGNMDSQRIKDKIINKIYNFIGQGEILDDISLLIIKQKEWL